MTPPAAADVGVETSKTQALNVSALTVFPPLKQCLDLDTDSFSRFLCMAPPPAAANVGVEMSKTREATLYSLACCSTFDGSVLVPSIVYAMLYGICGSVRTYRQ
eukprot:14545709-Ditylum_brightwellii.AAC.1